MVVEPQGDGEPLSRSLVGNVARGVASRATPHLVDAVPTSITIWDRFELAGTAPHNLTIPDAT